jgi:FMN phosphatase YigB (HAD superfamily)
MASDPQNIVPRPIRAVSFDLDGTLYATGPHRLRLMPRLLPQLPLIRAWSAAVRELRGQRHTELPARIVADTAARLGCSATEAQARLWYFLDRSWIPSLRPAHVLPGIHDALALLDSRGIPRAVASDHPAQAKLEALGLRRGWRAALDAEAAGALKPDPTILLAAAQALEVPITALLHIGDRQDTDGEAARAAGARYLHALDEGGDTASLPSRLAALLDAPTNPESLP